MNLSECPRAPLPASTVFQNCKANWGDIARIAVKHPDGASPFTGTDEATLTTSIETETSWTAAIALTTEDSLFLSPEVKNFELVPGEGETFEYADGDIELVRVGASTATATLYGLTAENEEALRLLSGGGVDIMFINKAGKTIGKKVAESGDSPFFRCTSILGSDRAIVTGTTPDSNTLQITFEAGALGNWNVYDTSAFARTI